MPRIFSDGLRLPLRHEMIPPKIQRQECERDHTPALESPRVRDVVWNKRNEGTCEGAYVREDT